MSDDEVASPSKQPPLPRHTPLYHHTLSSYKVHCPALRHSAPNALSYSPMRLFDFPCGPCNIDELLFEACRSDNLELLEEVLSMGPTAFDINYIDGVGNTALHLAARNGSTGVLEVLMYYDGINPNIPDRMEGNTPLHKAASCPDHELALEMVQILISGGANPKIQNKLRQSCVDVASNPEVRVLLEHAVLGSAVDSRDVVGDDDSDDSDPPSDDE
ncbi:hypothetical protein BGZ73_000959 [Actinomortierella ambigua]|nr:hypothetical protein BGZ73_000959 [Actinomortierella ambigua]